MPLPIRCGEGPSPQQRGAPRAARRRARVARRERCVRRRDRGCRVRGRSSGHVLLDRRPTLASCVSSPPTTTRSGLQRSSAVFRRATPGPPCVRGRMAQHVRGLPGRRRACARHACRACAAAAVMQVWPARAGVERCSSAERRAPVRLRRRRPIVPPRSTKRTACRASAARRSSSPAFRRARTAVALSPLSSTLSSLVR